MKIPLTDETDEGVIIRLIEEAGEVVQAATKVLRFGDTSCYPGTTTSNASALRMEIQDMEYCVEALFKRGIIVQ